MVDLSIAMLVITRGYFHFGITRGYLPCHVTTHDALWKCSQFLGPIGHFSRFTLRAHGVLCWLVLSGWIWVKHSQTTLHFFSANHICSDTVENHWIWFRPTPLKNMKVSWDYYSQYMEKWNIFQITNQWCFLSMTDLQSVIQRLEEQTIQTSEFPPQPTCVLEMSTKILVSKRWSTGWLDAVTACYPLVSLVKIKADVNGGSSLQNTELSNVIPMDPSTFLGSIWGMI